MEDFSPGEKDKLTAITKKEMIGGVIYFLLPFLLIIGTVIYLNLHWLEFQMDNDTLREIINVVLVIGAVLPARLFVGKVIQHSKAANAWKKKVVRGKITGKDGNTFYVAGQKLKFTSDLAGQFQVDDEVEVSVAMVNDIVIGCEKKMNA